MSSQEDKGRVSAMEKPRSPTKRDRNRKRREAGDLSRAGTILLPNEIVAGFDRREAVSEIVTLSIYPLFFSVMVAFISWGDTFSFRSMVEDLIRFSPIILAFSVPLFLLLNHLVRIRRLRGRYLRFDPQGIHSEYKGAFIPWNHVQSFEIKGSFSTNILIYESLNVQAAAREGGDKSKATTDTVRYKWRLTATGIDPFLLDYMAQAWPMRAEEEARKEKWRSGSRTTATPARSQARG